MCVVRDQLSSMPKVEEKRTHRQLHGVVCALSDADHTYPLSSPLSYLHQRSKDKKERDNVPNIWIKYHLFLLTLS